MPLDLDNYSLSVVDGGLAIEHKKAQAQGKRRHKAKHRCIFQCRRMGEATTVRRTHCKAREHHYLLLPAVRLLRAVRGGSKDLIVFQRLLH